MERVGEMRRWERMTIRRKKKCQRENVSVTYLKVIRSSEKETLKCRAILFKLVYMEVSLPFPSSY